MSGEMMLFPATVEEFMEQYKVVDRDHMLSNGAEFVPLFRMRQWFDHLKALPITNADRIRSMTDEELAGFLGRIIQSTMVGYAAIADKNDEKNFVLIYGWLEWLQEEATDGT